MPKNKKDLTKRRALKKLRRVRRQRASSLGEKVRPRKGKPSLTAKAAPAQGPLKPPKLTSRYLK